MDSDTEDNEDNRSRNLCDEAEELLGELASLHPELTESGKQLFEDYKKLPEDLPHLNEYLKTLTEVLKPKPDNEQEREVEQKRPQREEGTSQESGSYHLGFFSHDKKPPVKVHAIVSAETFGADEQILQKLNKKMTLIPADPADPADCDVVLIFCVVNSRVGSDVETVMTKIPEAVREKPVVLVVMHHTRKENHQTNGTQWSSRYENVKFQVEVLFHRSRKGLLKCE